MSKISSLNGELEEAQSTIVKLHKELDTSQTAVKKEDSCSRHSFKTGTFILRNACGCFCAR